MLGQKYFLQSIDGKILPEYLQNWADAFPDDKRVKGLAPFSDLWPAWSKSLDCEGDVRFVWKAVELDKAVLPLLLCSNDVDFTCIVVVAEVEKTEDFVYWNRVGFVLHDAVLWQKFGSYISDEFRTYINTEVLTYNLIMGGVAPL